MKPTKIAILLPTLNMGGAETLVLEEMVHLKNDPRFRFEVHVVFESGPLWEAFVDKGIVPVVWDAPHRSLGTLAGYFKLVRYFLANRFDILHNHLMDHNGPWVGKLSGLKVVGTVHNDVRYNFWERTALNRCDTVLACGAQVLENLKGFIPARKLRLLNNAILAPHPPPAAASTLIGEIGGGGIAPEDTIILSVGRLSRQKGYDILIDAFEQVVRSRADVRLIIAGDGPDKNDLRARISDKGLDKHVFLPGIVMRVRDLLSDCHIYVNSSRWEGLPMTLLEAMAHRLPIIAADVGGNGEVIRDRDTGLLVPPERPELLASAMLELLGDQTLRARVSANAFALFNRSYTINAHCAQLAEEYLAL